MRHFILSILLVVSLTAASFAGLTALSGTEAAKAEGQQVEYTITFPDGAAPDLVRDTMVLPIPVTSGCSGGTLTT